MSTASINNVPATSKVMNVSLWIVQVLLAVMFAMSRLMKLTSPIAALIQQMPWAASVPELLVRSIGLAELAGALGLLLPAATRIKPMLTPLAASGLVVVMIGALATHIARGELNVAFVPVVLGALAAFVAWGRTKRAPIQPRS